MKKSAARLLTLATLAIALATAPVITKVYANGDDNPSPPSSSTKKGKKRGMRRKGKRAGSKAGRCGTYMYFSKKARKCMDARKK